jgi:hypothetical protein
LETLSDVIVKKPWGYEYLCYRNKFLAIWLLNINSQKQTSMHCHPKKNTGFIVLSGTVELSFLNNNIVLNELDKIHIFKSRFHASKAISDSSAVVLEIESPEDKHDLVRLHDASGRENSKYETAEYFTPKNGSELWIPEPTQSGIEQRIHKKRIGHQIANEEWVKENVKRNIKIIITSGSLQAGEDEKILNPGDVIDVKTLAKLCDKFDFEKNSSFVYVTDC